MPAIDTILNDEGGKIIDYVLAKYGNTRCSANYYYVTMLPK